MKTVNFEQGSQAWKEYRFGKIGASDVPTIIGAEGAYRSYNDLLTEKITGVAPKVNDFLERKFADGHEWEQVIRDQLKAEGQNFIPCVAEHPDEPRFIASLDGVCNDTILECKFTESKKIIDQLYAGTIPEVYSSQIQWQFFVTGLSKALLCVVYNGEMIKCAIDRNDAFIGQIVPIAVEFLEKIEIGALPMRGLETPMMMEIKNLKEEAQYLKGLAEKLEERAEHHAKSILDDLKAEHITGLGLTIQMVERQGSVEYKNIPELKGVDLEKYRKPSSRYLKISVSKKQPTNQIEGND
jgi:putative phage-type endonuclease